MSDVLVSIVMPVFNAEKYLTESIDSILCQSFTNFELIIINDGSTDSSESIILSYNDNRIRYIKQANSGIGSALRNACFIAKGKYIARMDADDISHPNRLDVQVEVMEKADDIVLLGSSFIVIDQFGGTIDRALPYTSSFFIKLILKSGRNVICHPSVIFPRHIYFQTMGYQDVQPCEDYLLWLEFSRFGKIVNHEKPLIKYRISTTSITGNISVKNQSLFCRFILSSFYTEKYKSTEFSIDFSLYKNRIMSNKKIIMSKKKSHFSKAIMSFNFLIKLLLFLKNLYALRYIIDYILFKIQSKHFLYRLRGVYILP